MLTYIKVYKTYNVLLMFTKVLYLFLGQTKGDYRDVHR